MPLSGGGGGGGDTYNKYSSDYNLYRHSGTVVNSDFLATISGFTAVAGEVVYNAGFTGDADYLTPFDGWNQLGHLLLHNTTRGDYGLVGNHVVGTRTITLEDEVPATWIAGDTITLRSQTCVVADAFRYFDLYVGDIIPADVSILYLYTLIIATTANSYVQWHPFETFGGPKQFGVNCMVANISVNLFFPVPVVDQIICFRAHPAGAGNFNPIQMKLWGWEWPA